MLHNDIATTVLKCNNNVTSGDKACFFYVTLYQTKYNQKEEAFNYHNVCLALSKRIKRVRDQNQYNLRVGNELMKDLNLPDYIFSVKYIGIYSALL
mgnify:CR=1 FL=1